MVDPVPREQAAPILEGDRAEVDLPVASRVLGGESLFLQASYIHAAVFVVLKEICRGTKLPVEEADLNVWDTVSPTCAEFFAMLQRCRTCGIH